MPVIPVLGGGVGVGEGDEGGHLILISGLCLHLVLATLSFETESLTEPRNHQFSRLARDLDSGTHLPSASLLSFYDKVIEQNHREDGTVDACEPSARGHS